MDELMLRRRGMMAQTEESGGPLYPMAPKENRGVGSYIHYTVTGGNTVSVTTSANSRAFCFNNTQNSTTATNVTAVQFPLRAGDEFVFRLKDISFSGSGSSSNRFSFGLRNVSAAVGVELSNMAFGSGAGTIDDNELAGTIAEDNDVTSSYYKCYRPATVQFTVELWINGRQYI